jgi:transcriptional antiterminator RfaH
MTWLPEADVRQSVGLWYAVQTRPKQEERAVLNLLSLGAEAFLPRTRRRHRRQTAPSGDIEPLFPRYLFVRCDMEMLAHVRYTRGVTRILGTSDGPASIDDAVIDAIRQRVGHDGLVRLTPSWRRGDRVRIAAGPLKGLVGLFESSLSGSERVLLLLTAINNPFRVIASPLDLEALSA